MTPMHDVQGYWFGLSTSSAERVRHFSRTRMMRPSNFALRFVVAVRPTRCVFACEGPPGLWRSSPSAGGG